jgi:hypothetical protein
MEIGVREPNGRRAIGRPVASRLGAYVNHETEMCEKCIELDEKIDHYEKLSRMITDERALDAIRKMIEGVKAQQAALHPEGEQ